eukprot:g11511.t1
MSEKQIREKLDAVTSQKEVIAILQWADDNNLPAASDAVRKKLAPGAKKKVPSKQSLSVQWGKAVEEGKSLAQFAYVMFASRFELPEPHRPVVKRKNHSESTADAVRRAMAEAVANAGSESKSKRAASCPALSANQQSESTLAVATEATDPSPDDADPDAVEVDVDAPPEFGTHEYRLWVRFLVGGGGGTGGQRAKLALRASGLETEEDQDPLLQAQQYKLGAATAVATHVAPALADIDAARTDSQLSAGGAGGSQVGQGGAGGLRLSGLGRRGSSLISDANSNFGHNAALLSPIPEQEEEQEEDGEYQYFTDQEDDLLGQEGAKRSRVRTRVPRVPSNARRNIGSSSRGGGSAAIGGAKSSTASRLQLREDESFGFGSDRDAHGAVDGVPSNGPPVLDPVTGLPPKPHGDHGSQARNREELSAFAGDGDFGMSMQLDDDVEGDALDMDFLPGSHIEQDLAEVDWDELAINNAPNMHANIYSTASVVAHNSVGAGEAKKNKKADQIVKDRLKNRCRHFARRAEMTHLRCSRYVRKMRILNILAATGFTISEKHCAAPVRKKRLCGLPTGRTKKGRAVEAEKLQRMLLNSNDAELARDDIDLEETGPDPYSFTILQQPQAPKVGKDNDNNAYYDHSFGPGVATDPGQQPRPPRIVFRIAADATPFGYEKCLSAEITIYRSSDGEAVASEKFPLESMATKAGAINVLDDLYEAAARCGCPLPGTWRNCMHEGFLPEARPALLAVSDCGSDMLRSLKLWAHLAEALRVMKLRPSVRNSFFSASEPSWAVAFVTCQLHLLDIVGKKSMMILGASLGLKLEKALTAITRTVNNWLTPKKDGARDRAEDAAARKQKRLAGDDPDDAEMLEDGERGPRGDEGAAFAKLLGDGDSDDVPCDLVLWRQAELMAKKVREQNEKDTNSELKRLPQFVRARWLNSGKVVSAMLKQQGSLVSKIPEYYHSKAGAAHQPKQKAFLKRACECVTDPKWWSGINAVSVMLDIVTDASSQVQQHAGLANSGASIFELARNVPRRLTEEQMWGRFSMCEARLDYDKSAFGWAVCCFIDMMKDMFHRQAPLEEFPARLCGLVVAGRVAETAEALRVKGEAGELDQISREFYEDFKGELLLLEKGQLGAEGPEVWMLPRYSKAFMCDLKPVVSALILTSQDAESLNSTSTQIRKEVSSHISMALAAARFIARRDKKMSWPQFKHAYKADVSTWAQRKKKKAPWLYTHEMLLFTDLSETLLDCQNHADFRPQHEAITGAKPRGRTAGDAFLLNIPAIGIKPNNILSLQFTDESRDARAEALGYEDGQFLAVDTSATDATVPPEPALKKQKQDPKNQPAAAAAAAPGNPGAPAEMEIAETAEDAEPVSAAAGAAAKKKIKKNDEEDDHTTTLHIKRREPACYRLQDDEKLLVYDEKQLWGDVVEWEDVKQSEQRRAMLKGTKKEMTKASMRKIRLTKQEELLQLPPDVKHVGEGRGGKLRRAREKKWKTYPRDEAVPEIKLNQLGKYKAYVVYLPELDRWWGDVLRRTKAVKYKRKMENGEEQEFSEEASRASFQRKTRAGVVQAMRSYVLENVKGADKQLIKTFKRANEAQRNRADEILKEYQKSCLLERPSDTMAYPEPTAVGKQKALFDQGKNGPTHVIDYSKKWALPDQQHGGNIIRPLQEEHVLKSGKHPQNRDPVPFQVANIITAFENNKFASNNIGTSFYLLLLNATDEGEGADPRRLVFSGNHTLTAARSVGYAKIKDLNLQVILFHESISQHEEFMDLVIQCKNQGIVNLKPQLLEMLPLLAKCEKDHAMYVEECGNTGVPALDMLAYAKTRVETLPSLAMLQIARTMTNKLVYQRFSCSGVTIHTRAPPESQFSMVIEPLKMEKGSNALDVFSAVQFDLKYAAGDANQKILLDEKGVKRLCDLVVENVEGDLKKGIPSRTKMEDVPKELPYWNVKKSICTLCRSYEKYKKQLAKPAQIKATNVEDFEDDDEEKDEKEELKIMPADYDLKAPADWKWPQERNPEQEHDHQFLLKYLPTSVNCFYLMLDARIPGVMCNFIEFDGTMPQMKLSDNCRVVDNRGRKYMVIEVACQPPPDWMTRIKKMVKQGYALPLSDDGQRLMEARLRGERTNSKKKAEETSTEEKMTTDDTAAEVPAKAAKNGEKKENAAAAPKGKAGKAKAQPKTMKKDAKGKAKAEPKKKGKMKSKETLLPPEGEEEEQDEQGEQDAEMEEKKEATDEGAAPDAEAKQIQEDLTMGKEVAKSEALLNVNQAQLEMVRDVMCKNKWTTPTMEEFCMEEAIYLYETRLTDSKSVPLAPAVPPQLLLMKTAFPDPWFAAVVDIAGGLDALFKRMVELKGMEVPPPTKATSVKVKLVEQQEPKKDGKPDRQQQTLDYIMKKDAKSPARCRAVKINEKTGKPDDSPEVVWKLRRLMSLDDEFYNFTEGDLLVDKSYIVHKISKPQQALQFCGDPTFLPHMKHYKVPQNYLRHYWTFANEKQKNCAQPVDEQKDEFTMSLKLVELGDMAFTLCMPVRKENDPKLKRVQQSVAAYRDPETTDKELKNLFDDDPMDVDVAEDGCPQDDEDF